MGEFKLSFSIRPGVPTNAGILKQAYCSLWLLTRFGGLGSRARRGAGNLRVTDVLNCPEFLLKLPLIIEATTPQQLANELGKGLKTIHTWVDESQIPYPVNVPSKFDVIHPSVCSIWVIDRPYDNWKSALEELGNIYNGFRNRRTPDYDTIKTSMINDVDLKKPVQRAAFGLPVPFLFNSLRGVLEDNQSILQSRKHDRRASPLIFRIIQMANGQCAIVVLWFNSEFLPQDEQSNMEQLKLAHDKKEHFGDTPGSDLIEEFLHKSDLSKGSSLHDKGLDLIEVNYV
jgi:CRISPR-associated protein Cmr1